MGPKARTAEAAEEAERVRVEAVRREKEDLFRTDPRSNPELIDHYLWGRDARDSESMHWAIQRLARLEFQTSR